MRTALRASAVGSVEDLTARARIRDAAIAAFAETGFDATVREIAARAGVSPGLITHHFGSKETLRDECDREVLRRLVEVKLDGVRRSPSEQVAMIAELDDFGACFGYTLRSVREGGDAGRAFLQNMIDDARIYIDEAVATGKMLPSLDPDARAELLVTQAVGGMIMQLTLHNETDFSDGAAMMRRLAVSTSLVTLELYTQGLLPNRELFDEYLRQNAVITTNRTDETELSNRSAK